MEKIILGLLMLRGMSAYDLKRAICRNFDTMCSNSSGSIHTAIRKLLEKGCIAYQEKEKKKLYYITELGREEFLQWLGHPMDYTKVKNMELSKVYFLGLAPKEKRKELIREYITDLQEAYDQLRGLWKLTTENTEMILAQARDTMQQDEWNGEGIKKICDNRTLQELTEEIYQYQMEILKYGMDSICFEIEWYHKLYERCKE
ncbi:PadR family transcriptional regulator [Anaerosporobacter faecicola]|uniref:PadR family transcriptional regulator n=1 Tax=Anaerosporobacter faecicola TaxID=2718714 RepID=UPI00143A78ED|nr:PadR family transcriptional regulator [Anaerosporobacter faecicola]